MTRYLLCKPTLMYFPKAALIVPACLAFPVDSQQSARGRRPRAFPQHRPRWQNRSRPQTLFSCPGLSTHNGGPVGVLHLSLDECFSNSVAAGFPCSLIFWQPWLVFVFNLVVVLLLLREEVKCFYSRLHLGQNAPHPSSLSRSFQAIPREDGTEKWCPLNLLITTLSVDKTQKSREVPWLWGRGPAALQGC